MSHASQAAELLTDREVGELCNVSARHVRRQAQIGNLPAPVHIGRSVRWRRADILHWLQEGCPSAKDSRR